MTKIRVYQLAKELGLDNAELIEKMKELHFDVKNHMSTLSDGEAERIRGEYQKERAVKIDEKRIKPTVIRRRKVEFEKVPQEIGTPEPRVPLDQQESYEEPPLTHKETPLDEQLSMSSSTATQKQPESVGEILESTTIEKDKAAKEEMAKPPLKEDKTKKQTTILKKIREEEEETVGRKGKLGLAKKVVYPQARKNILEDRARQIIDSEGYLGRRGRVTKEELEIRRRRAAPKRPFLKTAITIPKPIKRKIKVGEEITIGELAKRLSVKASEVIKKLMNMGVMASINQTVDFDTALLVANEFAYEVEGTKTEESRFVVEEEDRPENLAERPPVVTIMGHVNHGKTRLLDAIRKSNILETEAGGITQHIGAYTVSVNNKTIVFIDTPGHEAFTKMRARGAKVTDIVVLVVAADDGVMPQTVEAINHAKAAGVPIIVAINKIDLPNANPERVRQGLAEHALLAESWGGETLFAEISAKESVGIQDLLELILLQAEMMEIKANQDKKAKGIILEAKLDRTLGPVTTVLVQEGTLNVGDPFVAGLHFGKVRALIDDRGERFTSAGPSIPVEVLGTSGVPEAGDSFVVVEEERKARLLGAIRMDKAKAEIRATLGRMTLEEFYDKIKEEQVQELNLIVKADVQGSLEALSEALGRLSNDNVKVRVIHGGVGGITETDIMLASASSAVVMGFNVRGETKALQLSEQEKVDIRFYTVIYDAVSDIRDAMEGMLAPSYREIFLGRAEVRELFHVPKMGTVAGSYVLEGKMERNAKVRIIRDSVVIYEGKLSSLRRFKDDVKEVMMGYECGIGIENFGDLKAGDIFESYSLEEVPYKRERSTAEKRPD